MDQSILSWCDVIGRKEGLLQLGFGNVEKLIELWPISTGQHKLLAWEAVLEVKIVLDKLNLSKRLPHQSWHIMLCTDIALFNHQSYNNFGVLRFAVLNFLANSSLKTMKSMQVLTATFGLLSLVFSTTTP